MKKLTAILLLLSLLLTPAWAEEDEADLEALAALPAMALDPETGTLYPSTVPPVKLIEDKTTREYEVLEYVRTSRNSNGEIIENPSLTYLAAGSNKYVRTFASGLIYGVGVRNNVRNEYKSEHKNGQG